MISPITNVWDHLVSIAVDLGMQAHPTGPAYITEKDYNYIDVIALCPCSITECCNASKLALLKFKSACFSFRSVSWKKSESMAGYNLTVIHDDLLYRQWIIASNLCRQLHLTDREDMIMVFNAYFLSKKLEIKKPEINYSSSER
jgi:hypothetical protein